MREKRTTNPILQKNKLNWVFVPQGAPAGKDQLFEKMLPAIVKIVKSSVSKFSGNPLGYSKFNATFKVEMDKK